MPESKMIMEDPTLHLIQQPETPMGEDSETLASLKDSLLPRVKEILSDIGGLYQRLDKNNETAYPMQAPDFDKELISTPDTVPVPVFKARIVGDNEEPSRTFQVNVRGAGQIEFMNDGKPTAFFQRIRPSELNEDQRAAGAASIRKAAQELLTKGILNPEAHYKLIEEQAKMYESGAETDLWIPFNEGHMMDWAGVRAEEFFTSELANMADLSAYRDSPGNLSNIVSDHLNQHPINEVFIDQYNKTDNFTRMNEHMIANAAKSVNSAEAFQLPNSTPLEHIVLADVKQGSPLEIAKSFASK